MIFRTRVNLSKKDARDNMRLVEINLHMYQILHIGLCIVHAWCFDCGRNGFYFGGCVLAGFYRSYMSYRITEYLVSQKATITL